MDVITMPPYAVYIRADGAGRVTAVNSNAFLSDVDGWTKIDEGYGDKYHHAQGNYLDKSLFDNYGVPRYKLFGSAIVERNSDELITDRPTHPPAKPDKIDECIDMCTRLQESIDKIKTILNIS